MDFMQIDTFRPISRKHNQKHPELKFKSRQPFMPEPISASLSFKAPTSNQTDFSPLVQEFLDDCGYSSK